MSTKPRAKEDETNVATNRRARFDFDIEEVYEAGLVLLGSEVKSLRDGGTSMGDGYVLVRGRELWLTNVHIPEYRHANRHNHEPLRARKLLLHQREIDEIIEGLEAKGRACIAMRIYFKRGIAKVELGLGRGKKAHDRREDIKERDAKREMDRARRDRG
ncbi:MAG: SsrA-binding protein SmpB [Myxococcales bacterium]|nr:SsrA-binding protein SmpB [Myxococcales bacterium]MCB9733986.1 SsrA-binding protein SmpB [Deltaproteobacteria bacterium]